MQCINSYLSILLAKSTKSWYNGRYTEGALMYLRRKVYDKLLVWKKESSLTLEITGARQVGKTYIS